MRALPLSETELAIQLDAIRTIIGGVLTLQPGRRDQAKVSVGTDRGSERALT